VGAARAATGHASHPARQPRARRHHEGPQERDRGPTAVDRALPQLALPAAAKRDRSAPATATPLPRTGAYALPAPTSSSSAVMAPSPRFHSANAPCRTPTPTAGGRSTLPRTSARSTRRRLDADVARADRGGHEQELPSGAHVAQRQRSPVRGLRVNEPGSCRPSSSLSRVSLTPLPPKRSTPRAAARPARA
jgi:hypothetical protein